jgi:SET domain-containing protein
MERKVSQLSLMQTNHGGGVFANHEFQTGEIIIEFKGELFQREQIPEFKNLEDDRFLQINKGLYLGPSGDFDDYINHSCNPNSGILILDGKVLLVAITPIGIGSEITFDYSTTMDEDEWEMDCSCGSKLCRGKVKDFKYLSKQTQIKYLRLGVVPAYLMGGL